MIALAVSMAYCARKYGIARGVKNVGVAFSAAGTMGFPLVYSLFGQTGVFYSTCYASILTFLQWTYGVRVITGKREYMSFKTVLKNPLLFSLGIGLIIYFNSITVPTGVTTVLTGIGRFNGPLAMIILGGYMTEMNMGKIFSDRAIYRDTFTRLIFLPLITLPILFLIPGSKTVKIIIMILSSAPVGSHDAIFANLYDKDYETAIKLVCVSTILSVATMPVILWVANQVL